VPLLPSSHEIPDAPLVQPVTPQLGAEA